MFDGCNAFLGRQTNGVQRLAEEGARRATDVASPLQRRVRRPLLCRTHEFRLGGHADVAITLRDTRSVCAVLIAESFG